MNARIKRVRNRKKIIRRPLEMAHIPFPDLADWPNEGDDDSISNSEDLQMCLTRLGSLALKALTAVSSADNKTTFRLNTSRRNENRLSAGYLEQSYHDLFGKNLEFLEEIITDVPSKTERFRTHVNINALINDSRENTPTPISEGRPLSNQIDRQKRVLSVRQGASGVDRLPMKEAVLELAATAAINEAADRKAARADVYSGIARRYRKTWLVIGSFVKMMRQRQANHYGVIK